MAGSGDPRGARRAAQTALLAASRRRARELTAAELRAPALFVAPHPDDEVLGVGATIARKREAGADVTIVVLTDGRHSHDAFVDADELAATRRRESVEAAAALGVDDVIHLGVEDGRLAAHAGTATERLAAIVAERRPLQLFAPCAWDVAEDHLAARDIARAAVKGEIDLLEYAVWFWDRWPWTAGHGPRGVPRALAGAWRLRAFDRSVAPHPRKRTALDLHATQTRRPAEHPGWPVLADVRGGDLLGRWLDAPELLRYARLTADH